MKKLSFVVLLCLVCGLFSCTQTESKIIEFVPNNEIVKEIHRSSSWFGNSEKLKKSTENISVDNAIYVVENYKKEYGKSVFSAIVHNVFISADSKANALKHIKDMLIQAMELEGVYTDDIDKRIEKHINYEKNKRGKMNSKDIDRDIRTIYDRYKQTSAEINFFAFIPANGKIDSEFKQGNYLSDCWLIATIKSLSLNPKGREMLDDLISLDDEGNVAVQLKGVDKEYSISKEELKGAKELAQGDFDVRALEIATRRYLYELGDLASLNYLKIIRNWKNGIRIPLICCDMYKGMENLSTPYFLLFGEKNVFDIKPNEKTIEKIKSGDYSTVVNSCNKYFMHGFTKHHVYAAISANDNYVFLSNPYYPDKKLKMTHADFLNFFDCSYSMKLSD